MGNRKGAYRTLVQKRDGQRPYERSRHIRKNNIKVDLEELEWEGGERINLVEDWGKWWAFVNKVMKLQVP